MGFTHINCYYKVSPYLFKITLNVRQSDYNIFLIFNLINESTGTSSALLVHVDS